MTDFFRKYYNQGILFYHRRNWLQKENLQEELRKESQRQDPNLESQNPNRNLKERQSLLVDTQLVLAEEQKLLNKFLVKEISLQVK